MDSRSRFAVHRKMRGLLSKFSSRALVFSFVAELTFVVMFVVNYSNLIVSSFSGLDSVPVVATITDRVNSGAIYGMWQFHSFLITLSPLVANALTTSLLWSALNGAILVVYGISQYRR